MYNMYLLEKYYVQHIFVVEISERYYYNTKSL